ncbi:endopeptidase La [Ostreibacterium oceani]|uniref:Lon protease n=1 Tax=Ostreibacterium oceani TaxID=2654998 RepID=A0A6N7EUT8_9GAMM|nr:endopeptidase La [Ostreibacterium oceani]MPV85199.1 endopeptidase La [Ostreibacterium oceani]
MKYNVLPLRDVVIYPGVVAPLFVGREKSIQSIEAAAHEKMQIVLVTQKSAEVEQPKPDDVYQIATLADIIQIMKLPDGTVKLLVEGRSRVEVDAFLDDDLMQCEATELAENNHISEAEAKSIRKILLGLFERYIKTQQKESNELVKLINDIDDTGLFCDAIASHLQIKVSDRVDLLLKTDIQDRAATLATLIEQELGVWALEKSIRNRVKEQMDKNQKEYYLNEQAKAIQKELEILDETKSDFGQVEADIRAAKMPEVVEKKCLDELDKLKRMPPMSSEATVLRNYLENMVDFPWSKSTALHDNLAQAQDILDASHFGLTKVKERIVEYLAVQQRKKKPSGSILCLVGPPGVGKTSIGKSIAEAVNRQYIRVALGGVRDEAEIRGHRRTYIGAMPGKIVQNITKAGVNNPLFLLDEVDKMGMDHRGDPASAMLEVLDPEQNHTFNDHYMEVDIDLSNVMFLATANSTNISGPLLDRMELIRIPGYTEGEKFSIAKQYLLPRNIERSGLKANEISMTDKALSLIVSDYTREAGVRQLDREIAKVCRKVVTKIALSDCDKCAISQNNLADFLGVAKYKRDTAAQTASIGRISGLAWTSVGGELLNIEVAVLPGKGKVALTGKLGEVMQESVQAAMTVVKSHVADLGVSAKFFQEHDFHIHLPEAATPKDGPSAGVAIATALLSAVMQVPISHTIAMTGEVTLQGNVLEIGGLKEKLFAAARENIERVFIPEANAKDLAEIPAEILSALNIKPVSKIESVFAEVFSNQLNKKSKKESPMPLVEKYMQTNQASESTH